MAVSTLTDLPDDLPEPIDDGGAKHLLDMPLASAPLASVRGEIIDLSIHTDAWLVLYIYPMTGRPDRALPKGWEAIPGARGCTPQSCAFRDHVTELQALDATVVGLSVQDIEYQAEMAERLHIPYDVVSDANRRFGELMNLPTKTVEMSPTEEAVLYKRLTLIAHAGVIRHVMYPVFPPDQNAPDVVRWLSQNARELEKLIE